MTRERDLRGMKNPDEWPKWPVLPLKLYKDARLTCGVLVDGKGPTIYLLNLFKLETGPLDPQLNVLR